MAVVRALQTYRVLTNPVWFGNVVTNSSTTIVIVLGDLRVEYTGQFSYTLFGAVSGTLTGIREFNASGLFYEVRNARADAAVYEAAINRRDTPGAAREVLKFADEITGSVGDDQIFGFDGNDRIDGGRGNDDLSGGAGADRIDGGRGNDDIAGGAGADRIDGGRGNDDLSGGAGADTLSGGAGRDRLDGGSGSDTASYAGATARVSVGLNGSIARRGDAVGDVFVSIENLIGTGRADTLGGSAGRNRIDGGGGADVIRGLGGRDTLIGGDGDDTLIGGSSADSISGGEGRDRFVFLRPGDSARGASDRISGFEAPGGRAGDRIDLSAIDADAGADGNQAFRFGAATGTGRLYLREQGTDTVIFGNVDRDAAPELVIVIADGAVRASAYSAADFIL